MYITYNVANERQQPNNKKKQTNLMWRKYLHRKRVFKKFGVTRLLLVYQNVYKRHVYDFI